MDQCSLACAEQAEQWPGGPVIAGPSEGIDGAGLITSLYEAGDSPNSGLVQVYDGEMRLTFCGI